jgi:hypothetical protein
MPTTFKIDENAPVVVEFTPRPGVQQVALRPAEVVKKSAEALDSAMNTIHSMARRVVATVEALADPPSQVEVEFGLKLTADAGAIIAKAGTESTIGVKLSWERKTSDER